MAGAGRSVRSVAGNEELGREELGKSDASNSKCPR